MTTEQRLVKGAKRFDRQILAEIYNLYSDDLYRYAMRKLGNVQLAEECVAETFSRFLKVLKRGQGPNEYLRAYLYRIAHNWVTDYYRQAPPPEVDVDEIQIPDETEFLLDLDGQQQQARIRWALSKLTPDQQQVIALKFFEGWKNQEIAKAVEKPIGAVKSLQHRALGSLRRLLLPVVEAES